MAMLIKPEGSINIPENAHLDIVYINGIEYAVQKCLPHCRILATGNAGLKQQNSGWSTNRDALKPLVLT